MSKADEKVITLNVRLKAASGTDIPRSANYTHVSVSQGVAYVDVGFVDPKLLDAIAKAARDGQAGPRLVQGELVARVALGIEGLAMLHQAIQRVLVNLPNTANFRKEVVKVKSET